MIPLLLIAAAVSAAAPPVQPARPSAHALLSGAEHAVRADRLDQASEMVSRAIAAGASGSELQRVLADLAYSSGKYAQALAGYEALLKIAPADKWLLEHAGLAALKLDDPQRASPLLQRATVGRGATWRAWNALGVVSDMNADWAKADECFGKAAQLAPDQVGPVNNRGWSLLMRGDWRGARGYFERAATMNPDSKRVANNLELANIALSADLPKRQPRETGASWAARLNDAGVAAEILGDKQRAIAAFSQAIDANGAWYERAANNLETLKAQ